MNQASGSLGETLPFETLMGLGVEAHARGDYVAAFDYRFQAFDGELPEPYDRGRAARDMAASLDRAGDTFMSGDPNVTNEVLAEAYAENAYREHKVYLGSGDEKGEREFSVSAMYAGIIAARQQRKADALRFIREAWSTSQKLQEKHTLPHQYDVNIIGRAAGIEAAFGKERSLAVIGLGLSAIKLARRSESNRVLGSNSQLSEAQVKRAQRKALIRGLAACTIIGLELLPSNRVTESLANSLLQRVVL